MSSSQDFEAPRNITYRPKFKIHSCFQCHYQTKSVYSINKHLSRHQNNQTVFQCSNELADYICDTCGFNTTEIVSFNKHKCYKTEEVQMSETYTHYCDQCGFESHSLVVLLKHVMHCGSERTDEQVKKYCSHRLEFNKCYQFLIHMKHLNVEFLKCNQCKFMAKLMGNIRKHLVKMHGSSSFKWYECKLCFYNVEQIAKLRQHILREHSESMDEFDDLEY